MLVACAGTSETLAPAEGTLAPAEGCAEQAKEGTSETIAPADEARRLRQFMICMNYMNLIPLINSTHTLSQLLNIP